MHKVAGRLWRANKNKTLEALNIQVVDARASDDFGVKNIKGSINLPFTQLLKSDGTFLDVDELEKLFKKTGIQKSKITYCMCQGGLTACLLEMACKIVGIEETILYDGSWAEYSSVEQPNFAGQLRPLTNTLSKDLLLGCK